MNFNIFKKKKKMSDVNDVSNLSQQQLLEEKLKHAYPNYYSSGLDKYPGYFDSRNYGAEIQRQVNSMGLKYFDSIYQGLAQDIEKNINLKVFKQIMKFFNVDYGTAESILELLGKQDKDNEILAISMLMGFVKNQIKEEIKAELKL